MNIKRLSRFFFIASLILMGSGLLAQIGVDSPYSRFGIGQIENNNTIARFKAMGGVSVALSGNRMINPTNPASYAAFDSLSFLFNAGLNASSVTYRTTTQTEQGSHATLSYITLGFPVTQWWRSSIGLLPYSQVGYSIQVPFENEEIGRYNKVFEGDGGLNQLYFGNAFRLHKDFSVGFNISYIFGRSTNSLLIYSPDSSYFANTKVESRLQANDFVLDYGLLYRKDLGNKIHLQLGLTYNQQIDLGVKREYLVRSLFGGVNGGIEYVLDTIDYRPSEKGQVSLPAGAGFGFALEKQNRWLVAMDINWRNWEKFKVFGTSDSLVNSMNIALGGQFTPNHSSISGYWKRVSYRMGARFEQTYLQLYGQQINEFGISFGLGLPLPRTLTTIDISAEVGRRGTTEKNLIQETFVNLTLGVSIYERWFEKRRYN
jgi:hypothetical protein